MRCWRRRAWVLQLRKRGERGPRERTAPAFSSLDSSLPATLTKKPNPKTGTDHVFFFFRPFRSSAREDILRVEAEGAAAAVGEPVPERRRHGAEGDFLPRDRRF